jgi:hypothetical protein
MRSSLLKLGLFTNCVNHFTTQSLYRYQDRRILVPDKAFILFLRWEFRIPFRQANTHTGNHILNMYQLQCKSMIASSPVLVPHLAFLEHGWQKIPTVSFVSW